MAHHKRKRPKHQRAGCLWCKPHKDERGSKHEKACLRRQVMEIGEETQRLADELENIIHA